MAQFRSYAQQGSFSDNQLQAPDQTQKIRRRKESRLRGMQAAQAFLEENRNVYLNSQKLAQQQESINRETNRKLEQENRQRYRDALTRDFKIEQQNIQGQAQRTEDLMKSIGSISQSAMQLYGQIRESRQKDRIAESTYIIDRTGLTYNQLQEITKLDDNLSQAEFAQQDIIRNLIGEGDTDKLNLFYKYYQNRGTKEYAENAGLFLKTVDTYAPFLDEALRRLPVEATSQDKQDALEQAHQDFLRVNFSEKGVRPELVSTIVSPKLRSIRNVFNQNLLQQRLTEAAKTQKLDTFNSLNLAWNKGGVSEIIKFNSTNPSSQKREQMLEWAVNASYGNGPNALTGSDLKELLDYEYEFNGKTTTLGQQFRGTEAIGKVHQRMRAYRREETIEFQQRESAEKDRINSGVRDLFSQLNSDGYLTDAEYRQMEQYVEDEGGFGMNIPFLDSAKNLTLTKRAEVDAQRELDRLYRNGNLTEERVKSMRLSPNLASQYLGYARAQDTLRNGEEYKSAIEQVKASVLNDQGIAVAYTSKRNVANVTAMQNKLVREFKANLAATGDIQQSLALNNQRVAPLLSNLANRDKNGNFLEIINDQKNLLGKAQQSIADFTAVNKVMLDNPNVLTDPKFIVNAMSESMEADVVNYFDKIGNPGAQEPAIIRHIGDRFNMDRLQVMNFIAPAIGKEPIKLKDMTLAERKAQLPPRFIRAFNVNRTNERVQRAGVALANAGSTAQLRGRFNVPMSDKAVPGARTLVGMGLPPRSAASLAGTIEQESTWQGQRSWGEVMNDTSERNYGLLSWAEFQGDRARVARIEGYLGKSIDQATDNEQLGAILREMKEVYPQTYKVMMDSSSTQIEIDQALKDYVGYGHAGNRYRFANQIFNQLNE